MAALVAEGSLAAVELGLAPAPVRGLPAAAVAAAEAASGRATDLGLAVLDRATGEVATGGAGSTPFLTASLSKVVVAVDMLDRRRTEGLVITEGDTALLLRALGPSDDSAMNALWSRFDGQGAAGRLSAKLGLTGTSAPRDPSQWGEMSVSASDFLRIWGHVLDEIPDADRDFLLSAMHAAPPVARDGFDQAFGLLSPAVLEPSTAAKQGWMCCFSGHYYLHSVGVVGSGDRFVVAILTRQTRNGGWEAARQQADRIAVAVVEALQLPVAP